MARDSNAMLVLQAAALLLVFPMRLVILAGLIFLFAGSRTVGIVLLIVGVIGYFVTVRIMRPSDSPLRRPKTDPRIRRPGEISTDRISYGVAERGTYEGKMPGESPLAHPEQFYDKE